MSAQLRTAIEAAGPGEVEAVRRALTDAADAAYADNATRVALPYRAAALELRQPAVAYSTRLVQAAALADDRPPGSPDSADVVDQVVTELRNTGGALPFALARELAAAATLSRDTQAAFALEVERRTGATPHSRDW